MCWILIFLFVQILSRGPHSTRATQRAWGVPLSRTPPACRSLKLSLSTYTRARAALVAQKMSGKLCESLTISAYMPVSKFSPK